MASIKPYFHDELAWVVSLILNKIVYFYLIMIAPRYILKKVHLEQW